MKCMCPKCSSQVDLALPESSEKGAAVTCPQCKASFRVQRESFAGRAQRQSSEISCASCGHEVGTDISCTSCGVAYPDYLVAGARRKEAERPEHKTKSRGQKQETSDIVSLEEAMKQEGRAGAKKPVAARKTLDKRLVIALTVLLVVVCGAFGAKAHFEKKAETSYRKTFALATYGIQVEADKSRKLCQKMAADWKSKSEAGQSFTPRLGLDDEKDLNSVTAKLDSVKSKLAEEPEKFKSSTEKLEKLQAASHKLKSLAVAPGTSLAGFNESFNKLDGAYNKAAAEFKAGIPAELMEELTEAAKNFRGLRPLLKSS